MIIPSAQQEQSFSSPAFEPESSMLVAIFFPSKGQLDQNESSRAMAASSFLWKDPPWRSGLHPRCLRDRDILQWTQLHILRGTHWLSSISGFAVSSCYTLAWVPRWMKPHNFNAFVLQDAPHLWVCRLPKPFKITIRAVLPQRCAVE